MRTISTTRSRGVGIAATALAVSAALAPWPGAAGVVSPASPVLAAPESSVPSAMSAGHHGRWILFDRYVQREPGGPALKDLFLVRPDGSGERRLMPEPVDPAAHIVHADWSPDGRLVVFEVLENGEDPTAAVWVVGVNGRNPQRVAACASDPCRQYAYPDWSPDGRSIVMNRFDLYSDGSCCTSHLVVRKVSRRGGDPHVWVGGERVVHEFTEADAVTTYDSYHYPRWSPDGRRLVYTVEQYGFEDPYPFLGTRLAVVGVTHDAPPADFITPLGMNAGQADWSPVENRIAFATNPVGFFQTTDQPGNIFTLNPNGTGLRRLTDASVDGSYRISGPNWTPDGRRLLVFVGRASDGQTVDRVDLGILRATGGAVRELGVYGAGGKLQPRPHR